MPSSLEWSFMYATNLGVRYCDISLYDNLQLQTLWCSRLVLRENSFQVAVSNLLQPTPVGCVLRGEFGQREPTTRAQLLATTRVHLSWRFQSQTWMMIWTCQSTSTPQVRQDIVKQQFVFYLWSSKVSEKLFELLFLESCYVSKFGFNNCWKLISVCNFRLCGLNCGSDHHLGNISQLQVSWY